MYYFAKESIAGTGQDLFCHVYVPPHYTRGKDCAGLFVLLDGGITPQMLPDAKAWCDFADQNDMILLFPQSPAGAWHEGDASSVMQVYQHMTAWWDSGGYSMLKARRFLVGFGSGASVACDLCRNHAVNFSAAVCVDLPDGEKAAQTALPAANPMPIWFANTGGNTQAAADAFWHWQRVNAAHIPADAASDGDCSYYNAQNPAQWVRLTAKADVSLPALWQFLNRFRRYPLMAERGILTLARDMSHLLSRHEKVDGVWRTWYTYAPDPKAHPAPPLVITLHGINNDGRQFMEQTRWDLLAQKYGFVAIAPTGYGHRWNVTCAHDYPDDEAFIRFLVADAHEKYRIDLARVYLTGFSMGAAMTNRLLCDFPFDFAAGAAFSGQLTEHDDDKIAVMNDLTDGQTAYLPMRSDIPRAMWQCYGSCEQPWSYPGDIEAGNAFWAAVCGAAGKAPIDDEKDPRFRARSFYGTFSRYRSLAALGVGHAFYPDFHETVYRDFFARHSRGENPIAAASAKRNGMLVDVRWEYLPGRRPAYVMVTAPDGFAFSQAVVSGEETSVSLLVPQEEGSLWLIGIEPQGSAKEPFAVRMPSV